MTATDRLARPGRPPRPAAGRRRKPRHLTHSIGAELNAALEAQRKANAAAMRTVHDAAVRAAQ